MVLLPFTKVVKSVEFVGNSLDVIKSFPEEVKGDIGDIDYTLHLAQLGDGSPLMKPLKGLPVTEIKIRHDKNAYRAMYTTKIKGVVYVLHAFHKKSKSGIATPKQELDIVKQRLNKILNKEQS